MNRPYQFLNAAPHLRTPRSPSAGRFAKEQIFSQNCVHPVDSDPFFSDQAIFGLSAPKP